jgi:hypothetical protein
LIDGQAVHAITDQYAVHGGTSHVYVVKAMHIAGDPSRPKSKTLSQIQDFGNNRARRGSRGMKRRPRPIAQPGVTVTVVPGFPFIEGFSGKAKMPASLSNASRKLVGLPDQFQTPGNDSVLFSFGHDALSG